MATPNAHRASAAGKRGPVKFTGPSLAGLDPNARRRPLCRNAAFSRALALTALALAAAAVAAAQDLSPAVERQIRALLSEKASRTPAQSKMDSHLVHAARILRGESLDPDYPTPRDALGTLLLDSRNYVEVDIRADVNPDLLALIGSLGGTVESAFPEYESIRATVPLVTLERIAGRAEVRQIRAADPGHGSGVFPAAGGRLDRAARGRAVWTRLSEYLSRRKPAALAPGALFRALGAAFFAGPDASGDVAHQANLVRSNYGFDGTGVKIGVMSDGVNSLAVEQAAGRLPSSVTVLQPGSGDEGTAMLEIAYTLAPGATFYYATAQGGQAGMANNIQKLADAGCNIIIDDWTYFAEGVFQDGTVAKKVNAVSAGGVFYFTDAQNSGSVRKNNSGTWEGDFLDSGATVPAVASAGAIHNFGAAGNIVNYDTLTKLSTMSTNGWYELKWSDPLGASANDYDLFLVNSAMTSVLAWSTNTQNGSQDPEEYIVGTASLPVGSRFIILKHPEAAIRALHLDTERGILSIGTTGATFGHNAASGAFTMAAADAYYAFGGAFTGGSANPGYVYTSDGPRRMFYNADGTPITPGNVLFGTNGGAVLPKPDITAADGVPTGIASFNPFYGTSAGGPHAGAIAALMLQARPSMTLDQMRAAFNASVLDIEGLGFDINSGAGIVMAPGAAKAACGYSATPSAATVAWVGDAVTVAIQSGANCPWTISGLPGWISGATSGKGNAGVPLVISANPGAARSATVSLTAGSLSLGISTLISQETRKPVVTMTN